jgi:hypothetical protein
MSLRLEALHRLVVLVEMEERQSEHLLVLAQWVVQVELEVRELLHTLRVLLVTIQT